MDGQSLIIKIKIMKKRKVMKKKKKKKMLNKLTKVEKKSLK